MPIRLWLPLLLAGAVALPAAVTAQDAPKKKDKDLITREELVEADTKSPDLYQAIKRLRPHFLQQNRGIKTTGVGPSGGSGTMCTTASADRNCAARTMGTTLIPPVVYLDGMKFGDIESLKGIQTRNVTEVRYLTPSKAEMDYGLGHDGGAIVVKLYHP